MVALPSSRVVKVSPRQTTLKRVLKVECAWTVPRKVLTPTLNGRGKGREWG